MVEINISDTDLNADWIKQSDAAKQDAEAWHRYLQQIQADLPLELSVQEEQDRISALFIGLHKPVIVDSVCPLCGFVKAESYEGHGPLLRCANPDCKKTYDPTVEGMGYVITHEEEDADGKAA